VNEFFDRPGRQSPKGGTINIFVAKKKIHILLTQKFIFFKLLSQIKLIQSIIVKFLKFVISLAAVVVIAPSAQKP